MITSRRFCALALVVTAGTVLPQEPVASIKVGDGTITGANLKPYENAWLMSVHRADGTVLDQGVWTDIVRTRDLGGRKVFVRTQGMTYLNGATATYSNTFDAVTLAPITSDTHGRAGRITRRAFNGANVESRVTPPGGTEKVARVDLPSTMFDYYGGMYGLLFAMQTLRVGATGSIPAVAEFSDAFEVVPFRVVKRETLQAGVRGAISAWEVDVGNPVDTKYWVTSEPPYIIKLVTLAPGGDTVWEIIR